MNDWQSGLAATARRIAAIPHGPSFASVLLGIVGAAETIVRTTSDPALAGKTGSGQIELALALLSLATTVPLGMFWAQPTVAAFVVTAACVMSLLLHTLTVAGLVVAVVVLYRLGRHGPAEFTAAALAVPYLALALAGTSAQQWHAVLLAALAATAAWAGIATRARSEARRQSADRDLIAGSLLEHTARGERARISRELHDVVAHHISMIAVQAETARLTTPDMPAAGTQRLSAIGDTARTALTEMRRLLGVLREDTASGPADLRPQPGLHQLNELLDEARQASPSTARLIVHGAPFPLEEGVELAGYRIIQEALTNARRHAPGAAVDVELHYAKDAVRVRVRDNGPGPLSDKTGGVQGGHGLLGMRERAAAVGGSLLVGQATSGGFVVEAVLPTLRAAPTSQPPANADQQPVRASR